MNILLKQIEADKHNIQTLVDMLPYCNTKSEYRKIESTIKTLVKEIKYQKTLIKDSLDDCPDKNYLPLFEVELPEVEIDYDMLSSFFGALD